MSEIGVKEIISLFESNPRYQAINFSKKRAFLEDHEKPLFLVRTTISQTCHKYQSQNYQICIKISAEFHFEKNLISFCLEVKQFCETAFSERSLVNLSKLIVALMRCLITSSILFILEQAALVETAGTFYMLQACMQDNLL